MQIVVVGLCFLGTHFFASTTANAGRKALLVGIDEYADPELQLFGCGNDVDLMRSTLSEVYGFEAAEIVELRNGEATTAEMVKSIKRHLIEGIGEDDVVVFYFAGHGTGVKDLDGDEADGIDEVLVTHDFDPLKPATWFSDDLIFELFQRIPAGRVVAIHDCCHSGTGNRGALDPRLTASVPGTARFRFADAGYRSFELDTPSSRGAGPAHGLLTAAQPPGHVFLAACQDGQLAAEAVLDGRPHGLFTTRLASLLRAHPELSLEEVASSVREEVAEISTGTSELTPQNPELVLGAHRGLPLMVLLGGDAVPAIQTSGASTPATKGEGIPLHRPPTLDDVAPGYRPTGGIGVVLSTDQGEYAQDDLMHIELMTDRDAYVELYYYGVDDQVYRLFPNSLASDNFVSAGRKVKIPGQLGFDLRLHLPPDFGGAAGNEVLKAVASTRPFSEKESAANEAEVFRQIDGRKLNPAEDRLIEIRAAGEREFGEAMVIYRIRQ